MRFLVSSSVRSLLALVAGVALLTAVVLEARNHSRRDLMHSKVMTYYMAANWHCREAMNCRGQVSTYSRTDRLAENSGFFPGTMPAAVTSWGAEATFHDSWADHFDEKARVGLRELEAIDATLLFR